MKKWHFNMNIKIHACTYTLLNISTSLLPESYCPLISWVFLIVSYILQLSHTVCFQKISWLTDWYLSQAVLVSIWTEQSVQPLGYSGSHRLFLTSSFQLMPLASYSPFKTSTFSWHLPTSIFIPEPELDSEIFLQEIV